MTDLKLGRLERFDPKSKDYPLLSTVETKEIKTKIWRTSDSLNQGTEGACVGFAWAHELAAAPLKMKDVTADRAQLFYQMAQLNDPWNGGSFLPKNSPLYYEGSSILGGAKALHKAGIIKEYKWCFGIEDVKVALSNVGPVVVGTKWFEGMADPNKGYWVKPTGAVTGGHAYLIYGISVEQKAFYILNSWGPNWGYKGRARISFSDFDTLLKDNGEACSAIDFSIQ